MLMKGQKESTEAFPGTAGGYSFVINLIPIYVLACIVTGRVTARHYVAFAPLIFVGTILAGKWCGRKQGGGCFRVCVWL